MKGRVPAAAMASLYGEMENTSRSELTIDAVSLHGPGIGTVVGLAEVKIAPLVAGPDAVPSGQYVTEPPVSLPVGPGGCHKQVLKPVSGRAAGLSRARWSPTPRTGPHISTCSRSATGDP